MPNTAYTAAKAATKSLKVSRATHKRLRIRAAKEDLGINAMAEAILAAALAEETGQGGDDAED